MVLVLTCRSTGRQALSSRVLDRDGFSGACLQDHQLIGMKKKVEYTVYSVALNGEIP